MEKHRGDILHVQILHSEIFYCVREDMASNRHDLHLKQLYWFLFNSLFFSSSKSITQLKASSCGRVLVSASLDGTVVLWDIRSKQSTKMHILKSKFQYLQFMLWSIVTCL